MAAPHMLAMTAETNARRRSHLHRDGELQDGASKHHIGHARPSLTNSDADSHARQVTAGAKSGTLTWTALKHVVGNAVNERVIVLDFESEHLVFKTPHGDVTKRFSFLSVNGTRRAGFASCFIDFDMLNQNAYKITFKSPEERQEFEEAVSALISHHPLTAGYLQHGSSADLFTEQANQERKIEKKRVFERWKQNILKDPTMILRNDPRWSTWLRIRLQQMTQLDEETPLGGIDISDAPATNPDDDVTKTQTQAIHPRSTIAVCVAIVSASCLIFTVIVGPYTLAFYWFVELCTTTPTDVADMFIEVVFVAEIFWTFFVGRYKGTQYLGTIHEVAKDYWKSGQLAFDACTSIPVAWIEWGQRRAYCRADVVTDVDGGNVTLLRMVKLIKPLRLLRLVKMLKMFNHKAFKVLKDAVPMEPDKVRIVTVGLGVFVSCHFCGCLFWLVKSLSNEDTPERLNDFLFSQSFERPWFCEDAPAGTFAFEVDQSKCVRADMRDVYILCFYFAMTTLTTVGYGDIGPLNSAERIYVASLQIFGTFVFATIMNQLSMVLDNMNFHAQEKEFRLTKCRRFLRNHGVDDKLSRRILDWASFQYTNEVEWYESKEIMEILPVTLRARLALALHEQMLSSIPLFQQCGSDFVAEVALVLVPERYNAGEKVVSFGQLADRLHVVHGGVCVMYALGGRHVATFTSGDFFGEGNLLKVQVQKTTVVCIDFSELWCLEKAKLDFILLKFPWIQARMLSKVYAEDAPADKARSSSTQPHVGGSIGSGMFRALSVQFDAAGVQIPTKALLGREGDAVKILRWSFMVSRVLRRLYTQDPTVRIFNRIDTFGQKIYDQKEATSGGSTPRNYPPSPTAGAQELHGAEVAAGAGGSWGALGTAIAPLINAQKPWAPEAEPIGAGSAPKPRSPDDARSFMMMHMHVYVCVCVCVCVCNICIP